MIASWILKFLEWRCGSSQLLSFCNLCFACGFVVVYLLSPDIYLVSPIIFFLFLAFFMQNHIILRYSEDYPFFLVTGFFLTFFYLPRSITIFFSDYLNANSVLNRLTQVETIHFSDTIVIILVMNFFLYFGFCFRKTGFAGLLLFNRSNFQSQFSGSETLAALVVAIFAVALSFAPFDRASNLQELCRYLLNRENAIYFLLLVAIISFRSGGPKYLFYLAVFFALAVAALNMLGGSRKSIFDLALVTWFILLSIGIKKIPLKWFLIFLVVCFFSVLLYPSVSRIRALIYGGEPVHFFELFMYPGYPKGIEGLFSLIRFYYAPIFDRVSFFDFSLDAIKNKDSYSQIINFPYLLKSLIDGLTPGFDVFGVAKISNALSGIYKGEMLSFSRISEAQYSSDQFGMFGFFFVLFGLPASCVIIMAICAAISSAWIASSGVSNEIFRTLMRFFMILQFSRLFNSYGLDWDIIYTVLDICSYGLLLGLFCLVNTSIRLFGSVLSKKN